MRPHQRPCPEPKTPGTARRFGCRLTTASSGTCRVLCALEARAVPGPGLVQFNDALALELGLEPATLKSATGLAWLSGVEMPAEAAPLAQAYAGHQFGQFSPHGDGRALLLGGTHRHGRTASGPGPQGVGPYAVFAPWRWQGGTGPGAARVPHGRGHARVGHSHDACAGGDPDR